MIVEDPINSRWWGSSVGRVLDTGLFTCEPRERERLLSPFAWAEFQAPLAATPDPWSIAASGFAFADAQIAFRIRLPSQTIRSSAASLQLRFADEFPFDPGVREIEPFAHERFQLLPGATAQRVNARYIAWARQLVAEQPEWCLEVYHDDRPQGWFCCRVADGHLELTLSSLYAQATIGGLLLYEAALVGFRNKGARVGGASCSVSNGDVHGIYSQLGARFTSVTACWLWRPTT